MQGARVIASVGCCVLASGLVVVSLARSELGLDVGYLLGVGVGVDLCFVPAVGAVQALCPKNPALAGGVAASGIGVGTLVVPVVAQLMIDRLGWREAMQFIGILAACGGLAALPLRRPPQTEVVRDVARRDGAGTLAPEVQHRGHVVLLYLAQLMVGLVAFVPFAHLVPFAEAQGWTATRGVYLISLIGIGSICGRILLGLVADSLGSCCTAALCSGEVALSLMLLPLLPRGWELGADVVLFGLGYGGFNALTGPVVAEVLGVRGICRSVGWVVTSRALGILIGP